VTPNNTEKRGDPHLNQTTTPLTSSYDKQAAPAKKAYKSVPENHKVLSEAKYHKVISDLETVLLDISTDGVGFNTPDGKISASTLKSWAEHLRDALEALSKAQ
jgi:hypothetical protein